MGISLSAINTASDPDVPAQRLTFSLVNPPSGATVNATNGIFSWRPTAASAGLAQPTVRVTDNGTPSLSATQVPQVLANPVAKPALTGAQFTNGGFQFSAGGDVGPDYTVRFSTNLADRNTLFTMNPPAVPFSWMDAGATNFPMRLYRVLLGP